MIVDEPTAGLDLPKRGPFLNLLSELGENSVVLLSTHISKRERLCTRMAIINKGEYCSKLFHSMRIERLRGRICVA